MNYAGKKLQPVTKRQAEKLVKAGRFVVCVRSTTDVCFSDLYDRTEAENNELFTNTRGQWFAEKKGE